MHVFFELDERATFGQVRLDVGGMLIASISIDLNCSCLTIFLSQPRVGFDTLLRVKFY